MGGIFSGPSAPPPPAPAPVVDISAVEQKARLEAMDRQRRGRAGTILTTDRGLLKTTATKPAKKSLLGE